MIDNDKLRELAGWEAPPELAVLRGTARPAGGPGRCTVCGWPLAESRDRPWGGA